MENTVGGKGGIHVFIALCSVKGAEGGEEQWLSLLFLPLSLPQSPLPACLAPSLPLIFHCTPRVLVFIQMFGFEWQFLLRLCTSG